MHVRGLPVRRLRNGAWLADGAAHPGKVDAAPEVQRYFSLRLTMTTKPEQAVSEAVADQEILPCPHCGAQMEGHADFMMHVKNDCLLSEWEFSQPNIAGWNRRASRPS